MAEALRTALEIAVALEDGRQSERALAIQRGCSRMLRMLALAPVPEVTLAHGRRADIMAVSEAGDVWIVEVKSSLADFRADAKWPDYLEYCDRLYFAVSADFPREVLPDEAGIIIADRYGAEVLRDAPESRLTAARRKAVLVRLARAAAFRLQTAMDPESGVVLE